MTHEFTSENWLPSAKDSMLVLTVNPPLEEKPIIQVYFYPDQVNNSLAVLTQPKQIHYSEMANLITIISEKPFNGYVVVK